MIYLITLLLSVSAYATPSAYIKTDSRYPLGEVNASRLLSHLKNQGYRSITIEAPALVNSDESAIYYGSRIRPGTNAGIKTFVGEAKSYEFYNGEETTTMEVVLKLSLYKREDGNNEDIFASYQATKLDDVKPYDIYLFYQQYLSYVLAYSKVAQQAGVDVLVIGSNLGAVGCTQSEAIGDLVRNVRRFYKGEIRLDFASLESANKSAKCVDRSLVSSVGVDLQNPTANDVESAVNLGYTISYLSYSGPAQEQAQNFSKVLRKNLKNVTVGFYSTDPEKNGEYDNSAVINKKPVESVIKKWLN
jgi:hypothetical protein